MTGAVRLGAATAAILIAGCGTNPADLKPSSREPVELAQRFTFETGGGWTGAKFEHALLPGRYRAVAEDERGTYFHGPTLCYILKVLDPGRAMAAEMRGKVWMDHDCGIHIPHAADQPARIYVVLGTGGNYAPAGPGIQAPNRTFAVGQVIGDVMAQALADAHDGKFIIQHDQPKGNLLREALRF